jgi:hypothetical protein
MKKLQRLKEGKTAEKNAGGDKNQNKKSSGLMFVTLGFSQRTENLVYVKPSDDSQMARTFVRQCLGRLMRRRAHEKLFYLMEGSNHEEKF